jgi:transposase
MARPCTICTHNKVKEIDKAIIEGTSYRDIAGRFGISKSSLERHKDKGHIAVKIQRAKEITEIKQGLTLSEKLNELEKIAKDTILEASGEGDLKVKCTAIREYRSTIELSGKVSGEYRPGMEITGKDGGPVVLSHMTDEEVERRAREILSKRQ